MEIFETRDYSIFKQLKGNRSTCRKNVDDLKKAISEKNLLHCKPILINSDMQVIDGQHRLLAAQELGVAIHYIKNPGSDYKDATILNSNSSNWKSGDYLKMYVDQGLDPYVRLKNFIDRHKIDIDMAFLLITPKKRAQEFRKPFKDGEFVFCVDEKNLDSLIPKIQQCITFVKSKTIKTKTTYLNKNTFWKAMQRFISEHDVDWDSFMEKLRLKCEVLKPMTQAEDYINVFIDIYNYKRKSGKI